MAGPIDPRLLKRAGATRNYLVASVVVGGLTAGALIIQAWLIAHLVSRIFADRALPANWPLLVGALAGVFIVRGLLAWLNPLLAHRSSAAVKSQLRRDVLQAHVRRSTPEAGTSASLVTLVTTGLDALDGYFAKYLPQLGLAVTVPFIVGFAILLADWQSAIIVAFTLPLIPIFMALIGWTTQAATARSFAVADRLANHFADLIEGLPTLQAFARARAQRAGVLQGEERHRTATMRVLYVSFLSAFALELLATLSVAVVAVTVGFRLVFGYVPFETALFVLILAPEAFLPVRQVGVHFHDSADGVAAADAAFEVIDGSETCGIPKLMEHSRPATQGAATGSHVPSISDSAAGSGGGLRLEGVGYSYPGAVSPALAGFDLAVGPGEVVALSGASGGGKSTALSLAMGFVTPTSGRVLVDGVDLRASDLAAWRQRVAWVAQEPGLVNGTVGDNVLLGHPGADDDDVAAALRDGGADFSADKPVGDDGEGLSSGERRRVAIARALLRIRLGGASLLILDEPTTGLDSDTEAAVLTSVRESGAGALIVSHRPAVLAAADRVVDLGAAR